MFLNFISYKNDINSFKFSFLGIKIQHRFSRNNKILLEKNGKYKRLKKIRGLKIKFAGSNNKIIFKNAIPCFNKAKFVLGNNNVVEIGETKSKINKLSLQSYGENNTCKIGKNFSTSGYTYFSYGKENNLNIKIGNDCMFATNVILRSSDFHPITNLHHEIINKGKDINIGNHCWLAMNVIILKGVGIADGSIVGTGSIVTKSCKCINSIYAGNPARQIKKDILWNV